MKNKLLRVFCLLIIIITSIITVPTIAADNTVNEATGLIDGIITFKKNEAAVSTVQEWIDYDLTSGAGITSEWYIIALNQYNKTLDFSSYFDAIQSYVNENKIASATSRQKYALTMIACGQMNDPFVKSTLEDSIGEQGIMSWIFGLHLLNNGVESTKYSISDVVTTLLSLKKADGGWALMGDYSDVDVTAMTVQALAPYYNSNTEVKAAIDAALDLLGTKQQDDGGYQSYGTKNPESIAQVIVALCSVGIDPINDKRFIKNDNSVLDAMLRYKLNDGSFCHIEGASSNETATTQVFYSLVSLYMVRSDLGPLYLFSSETVDPPVETLKPSDTIKPTPTVQPDNPKETAVSSETPHPSVIPDPLKTPNTVIDNNQTTSPSETPDPISNEKNHTSMYNYKIWACIAVIILMLTVSVIFLLCKKHNPKNFIFILIIGAILICLILITDLQSSDNYYNDDLIKTDIIGTVTMTIRCDTIVGKSDSEYIPADGIILPITEFKITKDNSVFDILTEAAKKYHIQMENEGTALGAHGMIYISGINYLYEFDFGDLSGWVYHVNGVAPSVGCGDYILSDGDVVEWLYTCNLGEDVK